MRCGAGTGASPSLALLSADARLPSGAHPRTQEENPSWSLPTEGILDVAFEESVPYSPPQPVADHELHVIAHGLDQKSPHDTAQALSMALEGKHLTAAQVCELVAVVDANDAFDFAVKLFPQVVDKNNFESVERVLAHPGRSLLREIADRYFDGGRASVHVVDWAATKRGPMPEVPNS